MLGTRLYHHHILKDINEADQWYLARIMHARGIYEFEGGIAGGGLPGGARR